VLLFYFCLDAPCSPQPPSVYVQSSWYALHVFVPVNPVSDRPRPLEQRGTEQLFLGIPQVVHQALHPVELIEEAGLEPHHGAREDAEAAHHGEPPTPQGCAELASVERAGGRRVRRTARVAELALQDAALRLRQRVEDNVDSERVDGSPLRAHMGAERSLGLVSERWGC
jgi:hypothetical protein